MQADKTYDYSLSMLEIMKKEDIIQFELGDKIKQIRDLSFEVVKTLDNFPQLATHYADMISEMDEEYDKACDKIVNKYFKKYIKII